MAWFSAAIKVGGKGPAETYYFEFQGDNIRAKAALEQKVGKGNIPNGTVSNRSKPPKNAKIISVP